MVVCCSWVILPYFIREFSQEYFALKPCLRTSNLLNSFVYCHSVSTLAGLLNLVRPSSVSHRAPTFVYNAFTMTQNIVQVVC